MEFTENRLIVALFVALISILSTAIFNFLTNKRNDEKELKRELKKEIEDRVHKDDCAPAMRRVGQQLDRCEKRLDKHDETHTQLKTGMAFLVGASGGDPGKMGLV